MKEEIKKRELVLEEIKAPSTQGMPILILTIALYILAIVGSTLSSYYEIYWLLALCVLYEALGWILFCGLKVLRPNEAYVLTLFGKYYGTLVGPGFYFVNPFTTAINPAAETIVQPKIDPTTDLNQLNKQSTAKKSVSKKVSLKSMTLSNEKQKINDKMGNPIEIGIVVIWRVTNTARATFNVDNYAEFLSTQCDSALRNIVRLYSYDIADKSQTDEKFLRGSSAEISEDLREEIQTKVEIAGLEIVEARITHLAYAIEIASAMLQRQQAKAIIDARQMIVEGAVGMVETALAKLNENELITLDEERKAAMVSNLLVVLCGNKDAQPIVNSGSLY